MSLTPRINTAAGPNNACAFVDGTADNGQLVLISDKYNIRCWHKSQQVGLDRYL